MFKSRLFQRSPCEGHLASQSPAAFPIRREPSLPLADLRAQDHEVLHLWSIVGAPSMCFLSFFSTSSLFTSHHLCFYP